jgi:hypothetical protein
LLAALAGAGVAYVVLVRFGRGIAAAGAVVGGCNGAISGWRRVYDWRRPSGIAAFVLDSSWGLVGTAGALVVHGLNRLRPRGGDYCAGLSVREGRHVYASGMHTKRGFALTLGNAVSNAGGRAGLDATSDAAERRRRFVRDHEGLHVWQNRWFGPLYPIVYGGWMAAGAVAGTVVWLRHRSESWYRLVETAAYYDNPFEYWAYRNDASWPPRRAHPLLVWRRRGAAVS